jgi:hypothetical protein
VRPALALLAGLLAALTLGACSGLDGEKGGSATAPPNSPAAPAPPKDVLEPGLREDPDGDLVPSAIEERLGTDPSVDECQEKLDCPVVGAGGQIEPERRNSTLLMLDSSGSMRGPAGGGKTKIDAARGALERYVTATPDSFELGFLVFGQEGSSAEADKAESCKSAELRKPIGEVDYESFPAELKRFDPRGFTPIAGALEQAAGAFAGRERDKNRIILVTDGVETCDGDPVAAARKLKEAGVAVTVDVVGFDIARSSDAKALRAIAEATGGRYSDAQDGDALDRFFAAEERRNRQLLEAYGCVARGGNRLYLCRAERGNEAYAEIQKLGEEAYESEQLERAQALRDMSDKYLERSIAIQEADLDRSVKLSEQLVEESRTVQRRLEERYGPQAALGPSPWACLPGPLGSTLARATPAPRYG